MSQKWHIITGEYPPQFGGVSDYTRLLATALRAAGDEVEVWAPQCKESSIGSVDREVTVHRLPGQFGFPALVELERALGRRRNPGRVLVQYVPQMYGWKAMNVGFCSWLRWRRDLRPWVMFHEVATPRVAGQPWRHRFLSVVTRRMAALVAGAAQRIFVSIPQWETMLRDLGNLPEQVTWLPVPSNMPTRVDAAEVARLRNELRGPGDAGVVGHFGTFGPGLVADLLKATLPVLLAADTHRRIVLVGRGSVAFASELGRQHPASNGRILARADLAPGDVAVHLAACDLLVQPYPDGVSSRRGSVMAGLALGQPIVTTIGHLTEPIWIDQGLVAASAVVDLLGLEAQIERLMSDANLRRSLGERARKGYERYFSLGRTIETLRAAN